LTDTLLWILILREILTWNSPVHWVKTLRSPLLSVLYLGLFWLLVYLSLSPLTLVAHFFFPNLERFLYSHRLEFLHFFTLGCVGTLILSIMTRVTRGHGGLPLHLGSFGIFSIFFMQSAMGLRVMLPLFPQWQIYKNLGGLFWTLAFGFWGIRYLPVLLREKILPSN